VNGVQMSKQSECVIHAARCQERAKIAETEDDKRSWLALAQSWLETAELEGLLERQTNKAAAHKS
jgi:hypothetical protein